MGVVVCDPFVRQVASKGSRVNGDPWETSWSDDLGGRRRRRPRRRQCRHVCRPRRPGAWCQEVLASERAPEHERGGDTAFTAGAMRVVYESVDHLRELVRDLSDAELATTDFGVYPASAFYDDMARATQYRADPELVGVLVETKPRHPSGGWLTSASGSSPPTAARHSRSATSCDFGVDSLSTPRAVGRGSSRRSTPWLPRQASRS